MQVLIGKGGYYGEKWTAEEKIEIVLAGMASGANVYNHNTISGEKPLFKEGFLALRPAFRRE